MRKIVSFMHVSLDMFVAGPQGEMNWIKVDSEIFKYAGEATNASDLALYGRNTWEMMDSYWPTAGDKPNASDHDREHSAWYNKVEKIVLSRTMAGQERPKTTFLGDKFSAEIRRYKEQPGKDIVIFGSPRATHSLMKEGLVDQVWLFVNPILLGKGIPMFDGIEDRKPLKLVTDVRFPSGVIALKYEVLH
ncbi:MAG: dihydrofolate reductase [Bacteroidetes bacterium]|nr:dihydrofolate reductase [Bacteroidota bacterium]